MAAYSVVHFKAYSIFTENKNVKSFGQP